MESYLVGMMDIWSLVLMVREKEEDLGLVGCLVG